MKKAVILLSGGLDSTTVMAIAKSEGYAPYALSFDYGQRHRIELNAAKQVALEMGAVEHKIMPMDLRLFGGSSLTSNLEVPKDKLSPAHIPNTYVPARNTIFLAMALAYAEVIGAFDVFIGANAVDYSNYPDCRPEFLSAFETMANLATRAGSEGKTLKIHAPLLALTKAQIIQKGLELMVDYGKTYSCYDPIEGKACGHCDSCLLRKRGFVEARVPDPTRYHTSRAVCFI